MVDTIAGGGNGDGYSEAVGTVRPDAVSVGPDGNVYIADSLANRIRHIDPQTLITTLAGGGGAGFAGDGGPAVPAQLWEPTAGEVSLPTDSTAVVRNARRRVEFRVRPESPTEERSWHLSLNPVAVIGALLALIMGGVGLYLRDIHAKVVQFDRELGEIKTMMTADHEANETSRRQITQEIGKVETRVQRVEEREDKLLSDLLKDSVVRPAR